MVSRAALLGLMLPVALLAGCSRHSPSIAAPTGAAPPPPFAESASEEVYDKQDPCNLLDPKEVEAVLGAPLAVAPYRSANATVDPTPDGNKCVYETASFRFITLQVVYEGGPQAYRTSGMLKNLFKSGGGNAQIQNNVKKNFKLDDGTEMAGEWDEASLVPMNCCVFEALRADQLITIDFTASPATLRQAATLVDTAYKRIDNPLKIDGGAGVAAAEALDVEAIVGKLAKDPLGRGHDICEYEVPVPPNTPPAQYQLSFRWRGGYSEWRSDQHISGVGTAAVGQIASDVGKQFGVVLPEQTDAKPATGDQASTSAPAGSDPAATIIDTGMHFAAVKRDVQVAVSNSFADPDKAKALVAAALAKL